MMEIIIVIVLVSIAAGFGIPSYRQAILRTRESQAIVNLELIHAAANFYRNQAGGFLAGSAEDIDFINQNFSLSIIETNDIVYQYDSSDPDLFDIKAEVLDSNGGSFFDIDMNQSPISATNPCCDPGTGGCVSLPEC